MTKAECILPLSTGGRPDLPTSGPEKPGMAGFGKVNPNPDLGDLATHGQPELRRKAEGTLPVLPEYWEAKIDGLNSRVRASRT